MRLSEQQINNFVSLYKKKYGVVLEFHEALEMATRFVLHVQVIESNVKQKSYNKINNEKLY